MVGEEQVPHERGSHDVFFAERDWNTVDEFFAKAVKDGNDESLLPNWLAGTNSSFGFTNVEQLHRVGIDTLEFDEHGAAADSKSLRKTFCLRVGYLGSRYHGYQAQPRGILTVESDLKRCLGGFSTCAAGRTDKDVSALSQLVVFSTFDKEIDDKSIVSAFLDSEPSREGRLAVFECRRVPRRMHPLFMATWRRYTYLLPINDDEHLDASFIDKEVCALIDKPLGFNAFAYGAMPVKLDGTFDDICTILHANALCVELGEGKMALCVELVGTRFLRRMVRNIVSTAVRESLQPPHRRDEEILVKIAQEGKRSRCAFPCPGIGLCLSGVGIDLRSLDRRTKLNAPVRKLCAESSLRKSRKARREKKEGEVEVEGDGEPS